MEYCSTVGCGINIGEAAGQTVMHLHVHRIPRFTREVDDPRGGVRYAIPDKGNYEEPGNIPKSGGEKPGMALPKDKYDMSDLPEAQSEPYSRKRARETCPGPQQVPSRVTDELRRHW